MNTETEIPRWKQFLDRFSEKVGGLPDTSEYPGMEAPKGGVPDISEDVSQMVEPDLSQTLDKWLRWQVYFETAVGKYAAAEIAFKQELESVKRRVFFELRSSGAFKGLVKDHQNYLVEEDERVKGISDQLSEMKQGSSLSKSYKEAYENMVFRIYHERKKRREEA